MLRRGTKLKLKLSTAVYSLARRMFILSSILLVSQQAHARAGVELMPIAVWQGKPTRPWSISILRDIRKKYPHLKLAHAISPAPMVRGGDGDTSFRLRFARIVQPGDDILLHVAPWKSVVQKAQIAFRREPTVFGMPVNLDDCAEDCGLDLSTRAFSPAELKSLIALSKNVLRSHGFGEPKAVFFDEGMITKSARQAAIGEGIREDWSGVEMSQLKGNLVRFPVYQWNVENTASFPLDNLKLVSDDAVNLDHLRFAIQAEIADDVSAGRILKSAFEAAHANDRTVRVPIVFNVEDLIHTQSFVESAIGKSLQLASEMSVPVRDWKAANTVWDSEAIRRGELAGAVLVSHAGQTLEAEFVSDDERMLSIEMAH
ncbi:MAG: hypothetical protein WCL28_04550 [bacterium]